MTAREKLAIEYPEKLDDVEPGGCLGCPEDYGYLPDADFCTNCYGDLFERCKKMLGPRDSGRNERRKGEKYV